MKNKKLWVLSVLTGCILTVRAGDLSAQNVLEEQQVARIVAIQNLNATPAQVKGEIVNRTPHMIRDVDLVIQYHWRWKNEFKPGKDAPGRVEIVKISTEIKPGQSVPFSFSPKPPLPDRQDGWFEPEVTVGGFTTVIPQG